MTLKGLSDILNPMYTDEVIDHFKNPRNVGELEGADGAAEVGNATCGDRMRITIKVEDGRLADVKFKTFGCGAAVASGSKGTEMVIGMTLEEALKVTNQMVADALGGLPPEKLHCSNLAADGIRGAIEDYLAKQGK